MLPLWENTAYLVTVGVMFGLTIGSFLNVVIYRVPNNLSIVKPDSHCPICKTPIAWYDNIPLISWLILGAKCRHCHTHISARYPLIEGVTGLGWGLAFGLLPLPQALLFVLMYSALIAIALIDLEHWVVPLSLVITLLVGDVLAVWFNLIHWQVALKGVIGIAVLMIFIQAFTWLLRKEFGLGWGDVQLAVVLSLWLGLELSLLGMFFAALIAILVWLVQSRKASFSWDRKIQFGPYLAIAAIILGFLRVYDPAVLEKLLFP